MENKAIPDPTENVKEILKAAIERQDDLRNTEIQRVDDKFKDGDAKYQIQFNAAEKAVGIASTAQEKLVAQALDGTKEAINKADIATKETINKADTATDKRFDLLSEKIDAIAATIQKTSGEQGIYVTHSDLSIEMEKLRTSFEGMLRPVITFMNNSTGSRDGMKNLYGWIISGVLFLITIASFVINFSK